MTGATVAFTESRWEEVLKALGHPLETAGVMAAQPVVGPGDELSLLINNLAWVPERSYVRRARDEMLIASSGWVPPLAAAATAECMAVFVHTHPTMSATHSDLDVAVDKALTGPFRARTGHSRFAHLVIGGTPNKPEIGGVVHDEGGIERPLRAVRVVGQRLGLHLPRTPQSDDGDFDAVFDRQLRAFGPAGQRVLGSLRVGVVGTGGTGSVVIEQLARLGVGRLTLIEPKNLTAGNVTRVYGSVLNDVGRPKVEVARDHVARIGLGTEVVALQARVTERDAAWALRHCDVVFGCTDDNAGRLVLARLGYWYLLPVIDMGVIVDTDGTEVRGVFGRITVCGPGSACLVCRGRIDLRRAQAETYQPEERERLAAEGYAAGLDEPDPAVVSFTTLTAATAVADLLARLFGYQRGTTPSEQILRIDARRISTNNATSRPGCYCTDSAMLGAGDSGDFLGRTWI